MRLFIFSLVCFIFGVCAPKNEGGHHNEKSHPTEDNLTKIKQWCDTAAQAYQSIIEHKEFDSVLYRSAYAPKIKNAFEKIQGIIEDVNNLYDQKIISDEEYTHFESKLDVMLSEVRKKAKKAEELGYHNPLKKHIRPPE